LRWPIAALSLAALLALIAMPRALLAQEPVQDAAPASDVGAPNADLNASAVDREALASNVDARTAADFVLDEASFAAEAELAGLAVDPGALGDFEPVSPDGPPPYPIIWPGWPIIYPGPIIVFPIFPYPGRYPCGDPIIGLPPMPVPPNPPGLPTPNVTPGPTATLRPVASPTPGGRAQSETYRVCPQVTNAIPQAVKDLAIAEPWRFLGYGEKRNPGIPYHPLWNTYRTWLSLRDTAQPYSICNYPLWKSGCP
jgi:hypothetical protein